jgi:predicted acylesterase/phospholipase RssA
MFTGIALSGGGVRGYMMLGALQELLKHQPLEFPNGIYGISIGSILATAVAYRVSLKDARTAFQSVSLQAVLPSIRLNDLLDFTTRKGFYDMKAFESSLIQSFATMNIDLTTATIQDAPQPLHIIASNITRCTPTIFAGSIRILDAIKASCALPGVFQPQIIYDCAYVDGSMYVPAITEVLPEIMKTEGLILTLSKPNRGIPVSEISSMPVHTYIERIYQSSVEYRLRTTRSPNNIWLQNETVSLLDTLTPEKEQELITQGASQLRTFLTQRLN